MYLLCLACTLDTIHLFIIYLQGLKNQKSWYTFFCAPNNMFAYRIMHLKQLFVQAFMLTCTSLCTYYKKQKYFRVLQSKLQVYSTHHQPSTQSVYPYFFIKKETTDRSSDYPEPNNQTTFCQQCLRKMSMVGPSQCLLV